MDLTLRSAESAHVRIAGDLDITTAPEARAALDELFTSGACRIAVDLTGVRFCDSTGLSVLIAAYKRASALGGALRVSAVTGQPERLLRITGLDRLLVHPAPRAQGRGAPTEEVG